MKNPFSISFGRIPPNLIEREQLTAEILDDFREDIPSSSVYIFIGVHGSGKTVTMHEIAHTLQYEPEWTVIKCTTKEDILHAAAEAIGHNKNLWPLLKEAKINLSAFGMGIEISDSKPIQDDIQALEKSLSQMKEKNKKLLICIDEVISNENIRRFIPQFQNWLGSGYPVCLLMTGLFENISLLQNEKNLTFLYRAPKVEMVPLNLARIAAQYQTVFDLSDSESRKMAELTRGYAFAYQVLGYLCFKKKKSWQEILPDYDACLEDFCYGKLWKECSQNDRRVLRALVVTKTGKVKDIQEEAKMNSNEFSVYRSRLMKKGILISKGYGLLEIILPRFEEFINRSGFLYEANLQ